MGTPARTFRSADRFKVESQLFHTHPADLVVLDLRRTAQAHRLHIWDLRGTHTMSGRTEAQKEERHQRAFFPPDSPELQPAAAGRSWPAAGRCRCWWASGQRGRPCGAACGGRSYTPCGSSPGWWAGGRCCRTHCSRWDRTGTPSTGPPALASCHHTKEGGAAELRGNACQRTPTTAPARQCRRELRETGVRLGFCRSL